MSRIVRHSASEPCPVCAGWDGLPRGQGARCHGFRADGWVHCSREDHAGDARYHAKSQTYSHREQGPCPCGREHAPAANGKDRGRDATRRELVAVYRYHDASGKFLFKTVRFQPKDFRQCRPGPNGKLVWNLEGVEPVLYRLPRLLAADPSELVIIPEGEKDIARLEKLGFVATCNPMGAGKWRDSYSGDLRGRYVVVIPDNDDIGRRHAGQVARSLSGVAASVKVVPLPGLPEHGDVSDFLDAGGTPDDLRRLIAEAPEYRPIESQPDRRPAEGDSRHVRGSRVEPMSDDEGDACPIGSRPWPAPPDEAAYRGLAGQIARAVEPYSEADPVAVLVQLLLAFGSAASRNAYAVVGATRHHCHEFAIIVGATSTARKGTSWNEVQRFIGPADPPWRDARILGGLSSGEGLIYAVRDPVHGKEPIKQQGRITGYQDVIVDHGVEDKRLLVLETEFGRTLKVLGREHNTLSAIIHQAFDGHTLGVLTKACPYRATDAHVSIIAHITNGELTELLKRVDSINGFANRFLWIAARRSKLLPFGGQLPQDEVESFRARLATALEFARAAEHIRWTRDAMDLWSAAYPALSGERIGMLGSVANRAEAHALRLALTYALLDRQGAIGPAHLEAALSLWDYAERSAGYIFGDSLGSPDAEKILAALHEALQGLTQTEIRNRVFQRNADAARIRSALGLLLHHRLIAEARVETGGRPAYRYTRNAINAKNAVSSSEQPPSSGNGGPYGVYNVNGVPASVDSEGVEPGGEEAEF